MTPDYVDAYYGPAGLEAAGGGHQGDRSPTSIREAHELRNAHCGGALADTADELLPLRHTYLIRQLEALGARVAMLGGTRLDFDEESKALYDAVAPTLPDSEFDAVLATWIIGYLDQAPYRRATKAFRNRFAIPRDRLDAVFTAAIDACRARTRQHIDAARRRAVHRRIRHRQELERLQLVPGPLPQRHPGEHRPADLHRSRTGPGLPRRAIPDTTSTTCCSRRRWSATRHGRNLRCTRCSLRSR